MKYLIKQLNDFDSLIIRKPLDENKWSNLATKLKKEKVINDFNFNQFKEPSLELIL